MEVVNKRYNHDHVSSYKNRGDKLGATNRFVRAHRVNEDRKTSRRGELTKRRGLALVNQQNDSIEEVQDKKAEKHNIKSMSASKAKAKTIEKENTAVITDERKAMLLKWREQREMKKKADTSKKSQKMKFAVRHIQHDDTSSVLEPLNTKSAKKCAPQKKKNTPVKRITRSSARLAHKQPVKQVTRGRTVPNPKETKSAKKPIASKKNEEQLKRTTRQSVRTVNVPSKSIVSSKEKEDDENKNTEDQSSSESTAEIPKKATPRNPKKQQRKSFAPANFQFAAPSGLCSFENYAKDFKFQPLSPASAASFFQGVSVFPSPKRSRDVITKENFIPINSTTENNESSIPMETNANQNDSAASRAVVEGSQDSEMNGKTVETVTSKDDILDSNYLRNLMSSETARLNGLCDEWEKVLESSKELTEDVKGNIRTAVGQAQLLINQRFKQFSGLIDLSEDKSAEKKATMSDLQGFWDMIYFQVEDVYNKMSALEKQKQDGWVVETQNVKKAGKKIKKIAAKKSEALRTAKSGGKSRIQELRAAMKVKMAEKKKQHQSQDIEECSFITVLTPVKKIKKSGCHDEVILTPVRRSLRNTPINQSASRVTPKVITTPKAPSVQSPGLRLTPEVCSPTSCKTENLVEDKKMKEELGAEGNKGGNGWSTSENTAKVCSPTSCKTENLVEDKEMKEELGAEGNKGGNGWSTSENTDEEMKEDAKEVAASRSAKRRSCLRSSRRRTRKSSHIFFQSPEPSAKATAGGTPEALVFTPEVQGNNRPMGDVFTPVVVSFDSPADEGNTCSMNAGHTPAMVLSGKRSLRSHKSKGTPISGCKRHLATPDSITNNTGTPVNQDEGYVSKRLRRSGRMNTPSYEKETFLADKYILPSTSSESEDEPQSQALTPLLTGPQDPPCDDHPLLAFTPLKDSSDRLNRSNLTPASRLQALSLVDDSPEKRRDSVFFTPSGSLIQHGKINKHNLICFSPLVESD